MSKKETLRWGYILAVIGCCLISGCAYVQERVVTGLGPRHNTANFYRYPDFYDLDIKKVAVVGFQNSTDIPDIEDKVQEVFLLELKKAQRFEIVYNLEIDKALENERFITKGDFSNEDLIEIAKKFHVDAIILAQITQYRPYQPLVLGIKIKMIQTITGEIIWFLDEVYDSSLFGVANSAKEYYFNRMSPQHHLYKWDIVINSMKYFTQFACFEVVQTLKRKETYFKKRRFLL